MTDKPLVGILMGSDSDLPVMQDAAKVLEELGITSEVHTLSAHRTPEAVVEYVRTSEAEGYKVFICGAGGAAPLAGVGGAPPPPPPPPPPPHTSRAWWPRTRHFPSSAYPS